MVNIHNGKTEVEQHSLLLVSWGDTTSLVKDGLLLALALLLSEDGVTLLDSGIWVETLHDTSILERILLKNASDMARFLGSTENTLDLIALEESGQISVGHLGHGKIVMALLSGLTLPGTVDLVQLLESRLSPDTEATNVTTRGNLQEIEARHIEKCDAWDVTEGLTDTIILVVDDHGTTTLDSSAVTHLTLSGSESLAGLNLFNICPCLQFLKEDHCFFGLLKFLNLVAKHEWYLWCLFNTMSF